MKERKNTAQKKQGLRGAPLSLKIAQGFKDRSRKDIQSWRRALMFCQDPNTPRFDAYFDLIEDLKVDGTLKTQVLLRKSATLSHGFQVRNIRSGEVNEHATQSLQQKWFYDFLNVHIESILYGVRLIEFLEFSPSAVRFVQLPERNLVPTQKLIYLDLTQPSSAIDYSGQHYKNWLIELGGDNPLGLINDVIPNLIWKRNVAQSWAEFCEKFGMPMVSATTNNPNPDHVSQVEKQLLSLAEASVGVFPEGTSIKFDEANRTDAYNVYSKFIEQNAKEIAGVIVGSNTLWESANNRSQTEVHERSLDYKIAQADRREIAFTVNNTLFKMLKNNGHDYISDHDIFEWIESKEELDLEKYWAITQGLMAHYEVDPEWISRTFNIPIIQEQSPIVEQETKEKTDPEPQEKTETDQETSQEPEVPKKKPKPKNGFINFVTHFFENMRHKVPKNTLFPINGTQTEQTRYDLHACCSHENLPVSSAIDSELERLSLYIAENIYNKNESLSVEAQAIAQETQAIVEGLKTGFFGKNATENMAQYDICSHELFAVMEQNVFNFVVGKNEARIASMKNLLFDEKTKKIRPFEEFMELARKNGEKFNRHWLKTEYNLAIAVGQNAQNYHEIMQENASQFVQYQTIGDANVRTEHQLLDGKIFSLQDREALRVWPPNGYGCRCEMIAVTGDVSKNDPRILKGSQALQTLNANGKFASSPFAVNRGDLKQVFTEKEFYTKYTAINKKFDALNELTFVDYKHPILKEFKRNLKPIKIDEKIDDTNYTNLFVHHKDAWRSYNFMTFSDYAGRKIKLHWDDFEKHTSKAYRKATKNRHRLFPHVKDVLTSPDEVWINTFNVGKQSEFVQKRYIKCYKDEVLVVDARLDNKNGWDIKTWYKYDGYQSETELRKGILIDVK